MTNGAITVMNIFSGALWVCVEP